MPCGPASTSIRSTSESSLIWVRPMTTPSRTTDTADSDEREKPLVLTPRIAGVAPVTPLDDRDGTERVRSLIWPTFWRSSWAAPTTLTETGTSCSRSSRFWAVTTISVTRDSSAAGAAVWT